MDEEPLYLSTHQEELHSQVLNGAHEVHPADSRPHADSQVPVITIEDRETHNSSTESLLTYENIPTNGVHPPSSQSNGPSNGGSSILIEAAAPRPRVQSTLDVFRPPPVLPNLALQALQRLNEEKGAASNNLEEDEFKPTKKRRLEEAATEDEGQQCSICFELWSNSGGHRISSLKCGHLFGQNCIEKWLLNCPKCPQCNAKSKRSDIRVIYAKAISAVDTTERDRALLDLENEKNARISTQKAEAQAILQYQLVRAECDRLKLEIKSLKEQLENFSSAAKCETSGGSKDVEIVGISHDKQGQYELYKSISISQSGNCRVLGYDPHRQMLVATKPSNNVLFPGYGLMKMSTVDLQHSSYVPIHSSTGAIRDVAFSPRGDGMVLTASADKTAKLTSMQSNSVVQSFQTSHPVWACAWDQDHTHLLYCGLQNGVVKVFDTRNTTSHVTELKKPTGGACPPITSLAYVPLCRAGSLSSSGLLMGTLGGSAFWEKTSQDNNFTHHPLSSLPEGACTCMSFDPITRHCLSSFRPGRGTPYTRHILFQLTKDCVENKVSCKAANEFKGGYTHKLLSRSRLFERPSHDGRLLAAFGNEAAKSAQIWDVSSSRKLQQLSLMKDPAMDILPFNEHNFLSVLTESKLFVYKWTWKS